MRSRWLDYFIGQFGDAVKSHYGGTEDEDMGGLERALAPAATAGRVTNSELVMIEDSRYWHYEDSWPLFSHLVHREVSLPKDWNPDRSVRLLFNWVKHIEIVSIILRFMKPDEFGILSPPVASLLCIAPRSDHVSYYGAYLKALQKLRSKYSVARVADVDRGLWSAVELGHKPDHQKYARMMYEDPFFEKLRLENLLQGIERPGGHTDTAWLLLVAEAMASRSELVSGLLLARCFEELLLDAVPSLGVDSGASRSLEGELRDRVRKLEPYDRNNPGPWEQCRDWRNRAVHPRHRRGPLTSDDVVCFLEMLQALKDGAASRGALRDGLLTNPGRTGR